MKNVTQQELDAIITKHELWLEGNPEGKRAEFIEANLSGLDFSDKNLSCTLFIRANLRGANLRGANLHEADLYEANLYGANLREANLTEANLCKANFCKARFYRANLCEAVLCEADLYGANLCKVDLREARLYGANLCKVDFDGANLCGANLCKVDLRGANLCEAILCGADLTEADLCGANIDFSALPLWCGSLQAHFDEKQLRQIAYHLVKAGLHSVNIGEDVKAELAKLIDFANGFHRVNECGKIYKSR